MSGVLRVRGTIDLGQFWPDGNSDADTSKIKVKVGANAFSFAADGKKFKPTQVLNDAQTVGKSRKLVISNEQIVVRLQGIDAPELHYKGGPLDSKRPEVTPDKRKAYNTTNAKERRQYWAETATVALAKKLAEYGDTAIACEVISRVDHPFIRSTRMTLIQNSRYEKAAAPTRQQTRVPF